MCEVIDLPFEVVNGVGPGIGVLDGDPGDSRGRGGFGVFFWSIDLNGFCNASVKQKCIRLV